MCYYYNTYIYTCILRYMYSWFVLVISRYTTGQLAAGYIAGYTSPASSLDAGPDVQPFAV